MDWWARVRSFVTEVRSEMRKVTFPSRPEVIGTTIVVILTSVIFAVFLFAVDFVIRQAYEGIFEGFV